MADGGARHNDAFSGRDTICRAGAARGQQPRHAHQDRAARLEARDFDGEALSQTPAVEVKVDV